MKAAWASTWNSSTQPRKQRKYRYQAPLHTLGTFLHCTLAKDLRKKYGTRRTHIRKDDKVKVMVGDHKGKEGKVSRVNTKLCKIYIEGVETIKLDGSKAQIPFKASNLMITAIGKEDKRFKKAAKAKPVKEKPKTEKKEKKSEAKQ